MPANRRQFLLSCGGAMAAMGARLTSLTFAADVPAATAPAQPHFGIVVFLFLRGGMDGLNLLAPVNDKQYIEARPPELRVLPDGDNAGLPLGNGPAGLDFRLHPAAKPLKDLYDAGQLAFVHAAGLTVNTRSHREAQSFIERGVGDVANESVTSGWLARHLEQNREGGAIPALAPAETLPGSLIGTNGAAVVPDLGGFNFWGDDAQLELLRSFYQGPSLVQQRGAAALATLKAFKDKLPRNEKGELPGYQPKDGVNYPGGDLGNALQSLARLIKADIGLTTAAIDFPGWDTHKDQPGVFAGQVDQLSNALSAFYADMDGFHERLNIVAMSEFGRRLKPNDSGGTEHGRGGAIIVLGGSVTGGKTHGPWPGLTAEKLDAGADLPVVTDYRTVLAELLVRRFAETNLSSIFPGLKNYQPLGIFKGMDAQTDLR